MDVSQSSSDDDDSDEDEDHAHENKNQNGTPQQSPQNKEEQPDTSRQLNG